MIQRRSAPVVYRRMSSTSDDELEFVSLPVWTRVLKWTLVDPEYWPATRMLRGIDALGRMEREINLCF